MPDLPFDVWLNVARFLPREFLVTLYKVNSSFLDIALRARYEKITFCAYDRSAKRLLRNLKDPDLSGYVRSVVIRPWAVLATAETINWRSRLWNVINVCASSDDRGRQAEEKTIKRLTKHIRAMTDALTGMSNITEYSVDWDDGPIHARLFVTFFTPVLSKVGPNLKKLSLKVPPAQLVYLVSASNHLRQLEELTLHLCTGSLRATDIDGILGSFSIFVRNLKGSLQSLSISTTFSSTFLDLSPFIKSLGRFDKLHAFALSIPFDGGQLSDPSALRIFLENHTHILRRLSLTTTRSTWRTTPLRSDANFWIRQTLQPMNYPFTALTHLELSLRPLKTTFVLLIAYMRSFAHRLESLVFRERPLSYTEVEQILDAFAHLDCYTLKLRDMRFRLAQLSPEVLDLISRRLPGLQSLELLFREVAHNEEDADGFSRTEQLMLFYAAMATRKYPFWVLSLAIPESSRPEQKWLDEMERVFVDCIPFLISFREALVPAYL